MSTVLITGSSRGLGLEWVRQCARRGWRVFATCRDPDSTADLRDLAGQTPAVSIHRLDVTAAPLLPLPRLTSPAKGTPRCASPSRSPASF
jgi:NAD(P)-dependent dehydrogenase (short-subunit alcohol dehydrogenase family)